MNKTKQLESKVEGLKIQLEEAKLELKNHLSKTIYFSCPKCDKKTSLSKLIYFDVETYHPSYSSWDDDRYVYDMVRIICPNCEQKVQYTRHDSIYYHIKEDKYKYYNENKNLFKAVVKIKHEP
jgi:hypothetical protein